MHLDVSFAPSPAVPSHSELAKAISQQPWLGNILVDLIKRVLPSPIDTEAEVKCVW